MTTYRILALDPGGTTGWGMFTATLMPSVRDDGLGELLDGQWQCGQLDEPDHHNQLDILLGLNHVGNYTIVSESFEYRNQSRAGLVLVSNEYIGVTKRFCQERKLAGQPVMQTASMGKVGKKSFVKKENLERLGLWSPGWVHAMDGYGHLLYYIIHSKRPELQELKHHLLHKGWRG